MVSSRHRNVDNFFVLTFITKIVWKFFKEKLWKLKIIKRIELGAFLMVGWGTKQFYFTWPNLRPQKKFTCQTNKIDFMLLIEVKTSFVVLQTVTEMHIA